MEATTGVGPSVRQAPKISAANQAELVEAKQRHAADWPHTTRLAPWALFGFVAMVWVIPFDSINLPFSGPVDMTLDRPVLVLIILIWALSATSSDGSFKATPTHWAFGAFILVAVAGVLSNSETLVRVGELELSVKHLALLLSYGAFFAIAASIIRPTEVPAMVKAILVLACITAIATIYEYRFGVNVFHEWIGPLFPGYVRPPGLHQIDSIGRLEVYGPGVQPLGVAVMLSLALPFAFSQLLSSKDRRERIIYTLAVLILIAGTVSAQKKTSMVGPLVCILVLIAYRPRAMWRLAPLGIVLIAVVHVAAPGALGGVVGQFEPDSVSKVNTTRDRVSDYSAITPDIAAYPLIGRGYESYDQKKHRILDNQYLTLAIGVGLLGLLSYLAIFATSFFDAHRLARSGDPMRAPPGLAAAAAIVVAVVAGALLDFLALPQLPYLFCMIAAMAVVLARAPKTDDPKEAR